MNLHARVILPLILLSLTTLPAGAQDWLQWRGPAGNGSSGEKSLPVSWSKTENLAWVIPLPGPSAATPIVCGDRVFISSSTPGSKDLLALCYARTDGKVLWQKRIGSGRKKDKNDMTSPSPVTDGKSVYFLYGSGPLVAMDLDGQPLWSRNLEEEFGPVEVQFGYSSSPLLYQGRLYVMVIQNGRRGQWSGSKETRPAGDMPAAESFLLAIDAATGKDLWKQPRPTDAKEQAQESYASPIVRQGPGGAEIIVAGGDYLTAHDWQTGKELWRWGPYNPNRDKAWRIVTTPVVAGSLLISGRPCERPLFAVAFSPAGQPIAESAWKLDNVTPDVCTPLVYKGMLYVLDGAKRMMYCIDPVTGKLKWQGKLAQQGVFSASPTGADDKIYCISESGEVVVLAAGEEFKILSRIPLNEEPCRATIAVADGQLFIRTAKSLYCVGGKAAD